MSAQLSVTCFVLLVPIILFLLGFIFRTKNEIINTAMRGAFIVLGIYFMILAGTITATIADAATLGVTQEILQYVQIFIIFGWVGIAVLCIVTTIKVVLMFRVKKEKERMGDDGSEG